MIFVLLLHCSTVAMLATLSLVTIFYLLTSLFHDFCITVALLHCCNVTLLLVAIFYLLFHNFCITVAVLHCSNIDVSLLLVIIIVS